MRRLGILACLVALLAAVVPMHGATADTPSQKELRRQVRRRLGGMHLSQGTRTWLRGRIQPPSVRPAVPVGLGPAIGTNVDANDPDKDLAGGQSETSVAASTNRVLAAWNDISGVFARRTNNVRASITGVGFSDDGGATFDDLIGLPNDDRAQQWFGDPTVVAIDSSHFVVGSLYFPSFFDACLTGPSRLTAAVSVATVSGGGDVTFSDPITATRTNNLCARHPANEPALIDKEFLAYDPVSRTLAMSYTRYFLGGAHSGLGQIEVTRAHVPADPADLAQGVFAKPIVIWHEEPYCAIPSEPNQCGAQNAGAYPAVAPGGDIYVAWERNLDTNLDYGADTSVYIHAALVPSGATHPSIGGESDPVVVSKNQVNGRPNGGVKSLNNVFIPGYSRGANDFPRIAYNDVAGKVVFVWNDASLHPLGDIWLRLATPDLSSLDPIRRVNDDTSFALHMFPAVSVATDGTIRTSWYDRRLNGADSTKTDYFGELRAPGDINPPDFLITTGPTDWAGTASLIDPNFGDYTDNWTTGTKTYYLWSDGRLGVPQPFADSHT